MLQPTTTGRPAISSGALIPSMSLRARFSAPYPSLRHRDHRKLVTPETRSDIGLATRGLDPFGHPLEKRVSSLMPQGVVDGLEPVEVEKKHREFGAETPMFRQRCIEPFFEQVAVREPRQSVEMGQLLDSDLGVLSVGDVFVRRNPAPVRHRVVGDSDRPTVGEHMLGRENLLARQSLGAHGSCNDRDAP